MGAPLSQFIPPLNLLVFRLAGSKTYEIIAKVQRPQMLQYGATATLYHYPYTTSPEYISEILNVMRVTIGLL